MMRLVLAAHIVLLLAFTVSASAQDVSQNRFFIKLSAGTAYSMQGNAVQLLSATLENAARIARVSAMQTIAPTANSLQKGASDIQRIMLVTIEDGADIGAAMEAFRAGAGVEYVEPERIYRLDLVPNDSAYGSQWGMKRIGMEKAWDVTRGSPSIVIGVIDTGIDYFHEDLRTQLWINSAEDINGNGSYEPWPSTETRDGVTGDQDGIDNDGNGFIDDAIGYDFVHQPSVSNTGGGDYRDPDGDPLDENLHGSAVSGIIAAASDNTRGIAGVAPGCKLMTLRAFDARGIGTEGDVAQAILYSVANGAVILNMSFGDVIYSRVLRDVIRYAYGRGVTMVSSAGNSGKDILHYPSAYDETISVSAITESGIAAGFSNFGTHVDIAAPGQGIPTTDKNGRYTGSFNGTSAATPFVVGVAALIKSLHPEFSPEEVRGILIASAEDLGAKGWDDRYGAGLLDAYKAVILEHPSEVRILSPNNDFAAQEGTIPVVVTAVSPLMTGYTLEYGYGINPRTWMTLVPYTPAQIIADTIAILNVDELHDTTYTLRLSAVSDKGTSLEDRLVFHIDRTPPLVRGIGFIPAINANGFGVAVGYISDEPTLGRVWYRRKSSPDAWQWLSMEAESENNLFVAALHYRFIGAPELVPGNTYEIYMTAENEVGIVTEIRDGGGYFEVHIPQPVSEYGFNKKPYGAANGRISGVVSDFNGNQFPELLYNVTENNSDFAAIEFNGTAMANIAGGGLGNKIPRAAGDANNNGQDELLASIVRSGFLYQQSAPNTVPDRLVWSDTTSPAFWPITIADVNNDGKNEVLAVINDTTIGIYTFSTSYVPTLIGTLVNSSPPDEFGMNAFNSPTAATGDFNGNGKTDIIIGDQDADFLIFESQGGGNFTFIKGFANDYEGGGSLLVAGDFDGDGKDEFALGFRTTGDDVIPFWFVGIFQLSPQNELQTLWTQNYYGVELGTSSGLFTDIDNNISAGNVDGDAADELVISFYPELYIVDFNAPRNRFEHVWYYPLANSNKTAIADFDQNGVNDFAFSGIDSVLFFEKDMPYAGPPPPRSFTAVYDTPTQLTLAWTVELPSPLYRLYRGPSADSLVLFGTFDNTLVTDPSLILGKEYIYAISAYDSTKTPTESPKLYSRIFRPHARPVADSATYLGQGQIMLHVSQDMGSVIPAVDRFLLGTQSGSQIPESVAIADQRNLLLSFDHAEDGDATILLNQLRDGEGILFDDSQVVVFRIENIVDNELYIVRVEYMGGRTFCVYYNIAVSKATGENPANYRIDPIGRPISAVQDPNDPRKVCITFAEGLPIGAIGLEYVLKVTDIVSANGTPIATGAGSTAGIVLNRQTLDDVFVYPNPWSPREGQDYLTFANLTPEATIRIYSLSGLFIAEVLETDGNGGVQWNLRSESGELIPPGVYLYYATGRNSAGFEVDPKSAKFAIVR